MEYCYGASDTWRRRALQVCLFRLSLFVVLDRFETHLNGAAPRRLLQVMLHMVCELSVGSYSQGSDIYTVSI